ncbi:MAG: biotin/lipoyl-binding protein, partial [Armatimonadota bacterium]
MRRRVRLIASFVVIAVIISAGIAYYRKRRTKREAPPLRTATVERRDVVVAVSAVGALEALTTVDVKANVAGEIVELAVDRGDRVSTGDLVARIDPTETQAAYDQAEADVSAALARVDEMAAQARRQREVTPAEVRAAEAAVEAAEARVRQAERALALEKKLTESNIESSEQSLEASHARLRQTEARAQTQPRLTRSAIEQAEADLRSAREALKRLQQATHPQERADAKAEIEAARVTVDNDAKALRRLRELHDMGYVSRQEMEDAEKRLADSQRRFDSAKAAYDTLEQKQAADVREAQARVQQAEAALDAARANEVEVDVLNGGDIPILRDN